MMTEAINSFKNDDKLMSSERCINKGLQAESHHFIKNMKNVTDHRL